jgi:hypothetical protein
MDTKKNLAEMKWALVGPADCADLLYLSYFFHDWLVYYITKVPFCLFKSEKVCLLVILVSTFASLIFSSALFFLFHPFFQVRLTC